jgi:hypothetical protein
MARKMWQRLSQGAPTHAVTEKLSLTLRPPHRASSPLKWRLFEGMSSSVNRVRRVRVGAASAMAATTRRANASMAGPGAMLLGGVGVCGPGQLARFLDPRVMGRSRDDSLEFINRFREYF